MATAQALDLSVMYERDETAWLEAMSALAANGRYAEMDFRNLSEYLADMAKRDRREVFSRLVVLLSHLLKWEHQPERRSGSWRGTIRGWAGSPRSTAIRAFALPSRACRTDSARSPRTPTRRWTRCLGRRWRRRSERRS